MKIPIVGKTISNAVQNYDGAQVLDLELEFTDGTSCSFCTIVNPGFEFTFYKDKESDGNKFKL